MDLIDEIIEAEGNSKKTNDPDDSGGITQYGISKNANPEAWADGKVTYEEARKIYQAKYITRPGFDLIPDETLRAQVIDMGVMSGPATATRTLQTVLGVAVDGKLGNETLNAIFKFPPGQVFGCPVPGTVALNVAFQQARVLHLAKVTRDGPKNSKYIYGWLKRAFKCG